MQAIRAKDTKLENQIITDLWRNGLRFRRNVKDLKGKPDIAIKKYRVVVFIDSCFWHGCKSHCRMPKSNVDYWQNKIKRNKKRDRKINKFYNDENWRILRIWEHQVKDDSEGVVDKIIEFVTNAKLEKFI